MAESKTKKLNRFKVKRYQIQMKIIDLCVKSAFITSLSLEQSTSINNQIKKLGKKKELYDRKIKELEDSIYEKRQEANARTM